MDDKIPTKSYSLKTLMPGWQNYSMAYPKDYDAYDPVSFPAPKNLFLSSYQTFGNDRASWQTHYQASYLDFPKPKSSSIRPMINIATFHTTLGESREKYSDQIGITDIADDGDKIDFTTTTSLDYKSSYQIKPPKYCDPSCLKPETKYRRIIYDSNDVRRPGLGKFYDEGLDYINWKRNPVQPPPYRINYPDSF